MLYRLSFLLLLLLSACKSKVEKTSPEVGPVTESVYASGLVKARDQYQAFATASGLVQEVLREEGDTLKKGDPILVISNETQQLNRRNAELAAQFADLAANRGKLAEARSAIDLAHNRLKVDSSLFYRQRALWDQQIGTKVELEQRELAFENSRNLLRSALIRYQDLERQLEFSASQSRNNLQISGRMENDFTLRSEMDGIVYGVYKTKGELVGPQTPLAVVGHASEFVLEMQVDEYDILKIKPGQKVIVTLDSYRGQAFEAKIYKVNPLMNERSKTFLVEAEFVTRPERLYPNISFEASIVIQEKTKALLVPRAFVQNDSIVTLESGDQAVIRTGMKDYKMVEVLSGLKQTDIITRPK